MIQDPIVLAACLAGAVAAGWASAYVLKIVLQVQVRALLLVAMNIVLTLWAAWAVPPGIAFSLSCLLAWTLAALAVADALTLRLPDVFTLPLIVVGIPVAWLLPEPDVLGHVIGAIAGFAAFAILAWLYYRVRGHEGLGLGDAKLVAAAGAWLGWQALPSVVLVGAIGGIAFVLARYLIRGPTALNERMPFGVPLCAAFWLAWLYGPLVGFAA